MEGVRTTMIFTPTSPAIKTFIEREDKINNHLVDALDTPGKQIVLYGHSGCGKTTLLTNKLNQTYEKTIITRCMAGMTYENIILDGFDQLGKFYHESKTTTSAKLSPSITLSYSEIKSTFKLGEISRSTESSSKNILPPQLTAQRLASFFGELKSCWVLEDFHKIKGAEKTKTSQLMKVFMDMSVNYPELKIIAIGAVGSARHVIEYDKEMNNRVSEIFIPYMKDEEIEEIINRGEKLLNLKFSKDVKQKVIKYSCGLPSICHQLCLNICFNKRIRTTAKERESINLSDLDDAIEKFVAERSDTLKAEFDKAIRVPNHSKINLPKQILKALMTFSKDEFSFDKICGALQRLKFKKEDVEKMLNELCTPERSEILVYDSNSNLYRFNNLFVKAYTQLQFKEELEKSFSTPKGRDEKIVTRLLEIIEKDISEELDDEYFIEDIGS